MGNALAKRVFENVLHDWADPWRWNVPQWSDRQGFCVNVKEKDDCVELTADLPGVKKENIDISLESGLLTIQAQSEEEKQEENERYIYRERHAGTVARSFRLADSLDPSTIDAQLANGVLRVTIKKHEKSQLRKITVKD